jgi:hypothetical protein
MNLINPVSQITTYLLTRLSDVINMWFKIQSHLQIKNFFQISHVVHFYFMLKKMDDALTYGALPAG